MDLRHWLCWRGTSPPEEPSLHYAQTQQCRRSWRSGRLRTFCGLAPSPRRQFYSPYNNDHTTVGALDTHNAVQALREFHKAHAQSMMNGVLEYPYAYPYPEVDGGEERGEETAGGDHEEREGTPDDPRGFQGGQRDETVHIRRKSAKAPFPGLAPLVPVNKRVLHQEDSEGKEGVRGTDGRSVISTGDDHWDGQPQNRRRTADSSSTSSRFSAPKPLKRVRSTVLEFYNSARSQIARIKRRTSAVTDADDVGARPGGRRKSGFNRDEEGVGYGGNDEKSQKGPDEDASQDSADSRGVLQRPLLNLDQFHENSQFAGKDTDVEGPSWRSFSRLAQGLSRQFKLGQGVSRELESILGVEGDGSGGRGIVLHPEDVHTATVIFLHGFGDTARTWAAALQGFGLRHVKYVLPTASHQISKATMGVPQRAWFNVGARSGDKVLEADEDGLEESIKRIDELVRGELDLGISAERILVGGFSQGGAVALSMLMAGSNVMFGGVFALSGWLPVPPLDLESIQVSPKLLKSPILLVSGLKDKLVPAQSTRKSKEILTQLGFQDVRYHCIQDAAHDVNDQIMSLLNFFVARQVPLNFHDSNRFTNAY